MREAFGPGGLLENATKADVSEGCPDVFCGQLTIVPIPLGRPVQHSEEGQGRHPSIEIRTNRSCQDSFLDDVFPLLLVAPHQFAQFANLLVRKLQTFGQGDRKTRKLVPDHFHVGTTRSAKTGLHRAPALEHGVEFGVRQAERANDDFVQKLLLAVDVVIEAPFQNPQFGSNVFHGRGPITPSPENASCCVEDFVPVAGTPGRASVGQVPRSGCHARNNRVPDPNGYRLRFTCCSANVRIIDMEDTVDPVC